MAVQAAVRQAVRRRLTADLLLTYSSHLGGLGTEYRPTFTGGAAWGPFLGLLSRSPPAALDRNGANHYFPALDYLT